MKDFTALKVVERPGGPVIYAEKPWVPGEAIESLVTVDGIVPGASLPRACKGSPAYDVDTFNWFVRSLSVGEPPAADKIQLWQLNDLREAAGLLRGPEIPRKGEFL